MNNRPDYIPENIWGRELKVMEFSRYFSIDRASPGTFITKRKNEGRPLEFILKESNSSIHSHYTSYSVKVVVDEASKDGLLVEPPINGELTYANLKTSISDEQKVLRKLRAEIEDLKKSKDYEVKQAKDSVALSVLSGFLKIKLPSYEDIIASSDKFIPCCGIYFLINGDSIVYVGQSVNVPSRVSSHYLDAAKDFNKFCYIPCNKEHLDAIESLYIHMFKPSLNGRGSEATKVKNPRYINAPMSQDEIYAFATNTASIQQINNFSKRKLYV